jgi:hypothetical protein
VILLVRASGYEKDRPDITSNIRAAQIECSPTDAGTPAGNPTSSVPTPEAAFTSTPFPTSTPYVAPTP